MAAVGSAVKDTVHINMQAFHVGADGGGEFSSK
jgi:hypothetical protein